MWLSFVIRSGEDWRLFISQFKSNLSVFLKRTVTPRESSRLDSHQDHGSTDIIEGGSCKGRETIGVNRLRPRFGHRDENQRKNRIAREFTLITRSGIPSLESCFNMRIVQLNLLYLYPIYFKQSHSLTCYLNGTNVNCMK